MVGEKKLSQIVGVRALINEYSRQLRNCKAFEFKRKRLLKKLVIDFEERIERIKNQ